LVCTCGTSDMDGFIDSKNDFTDSDDDWNDLEAKSDIVLSQIQIKVQITHKTGYLFHFGFPTMNQHS
jgi:hypothetical protein